MNTVASSGYAVRAEGPHERPDIRLTSGALVRHFPMCNGATEAVFERSTGTDDEWSEYCELMRLAYFSVVIPWSATPTKWHPTEASGPFAVLTRGAFQTAREAVAWAEMNLAGQPYSVRVYRFEPEMAGVAS